jgi:hypothetical protein
VGGIEPARVAAAGGRIPPILGVRGWGCSRGGHRLDRRLWFRCRDGNGNRQTATGPGIAAPGIFLSGRTVFRSIL